MKNPQKMKEVSPLPGGTSFVAGHINNWFLFRGF